MSLSSTMASNIALWTIDQLIPYAHNACTHSDDQIARIAASMLEYGVNNPILVDKEGGIVVWDMDGCGRHRRSAWSVCLWWH